MGYNNTCGIDPMKLIYFVNLYLFGLACGSHNNCSVVRPDFCKMPLVPRHMDLLDAFIKFAKLVWFPKPKDRDFNITQLKSLVSKINKEFETGINFTCPIDQYDEYIMSYEAIISDFTSKLVSKKDSLARPLLLQTGVAGSQGVSLFNRDPFSRDRSLDADRTNMK